MTMRRCLVALSISWCVASGLAAQVGAAPPPSNPPPAVDSAPRQPLPSEPPPETRPFAVAALASSSVVVIGGVLGLLLFVRWRERGAARVKRTGAPAHSH